MRIITLAILLFFVSCINNRNDTKITDLSKSTYDTINCANNINTPNIEILVFYRDQGWGYDIFINKRIYIHQPNIPSLPGLSGFTTKDKAQRTAELVREKILNNIVPPSVTKDELVGIDAL